MPAQSRVKTNRRRFLQQTAALLPLVSAWPLRAGEAGPGFRFDPSQNIIPAPDDPAQWPAFRDALARWRAETRARLNYSDALYHRKEFAWAAANYSCCFLMVCDETFYDWRAGRYTVDAFAEHGQREFGGYDSVVLWHAYPRIGVDERNQFDFYRDLPGGLTGVRGAVRQFQRRGARVYLDYNPWDTGTRREGKSDLESLVELVRGLEADGIFLDTMSKGGADFRARLDAAWPGVILEGEDAVPLENLHDHHASWAQWFADSNVPGVLRLKWFERRHMQHQIRRWDFDHTGELQAAWMNGSGMMVWENVFGSWVPWNQRDRSLLRAMLPIQRRFTRLFSGEEWTPLVPVEQPGVFASLWEGDDLRLWTLVNRTERGVEGPLLRVVSKPGDRYFDLIAGSEASSKSDGAAVLLSGLIPPRGVGCLLSGKNSHLSKDFSQFLKRQARMNARSVFDTARPQAQTRLLAVRPTPLRADVPDGMVGIPPATLELSIDMRVRECGFYESMPPTNYGLQDSYGFQVRNFRRRVELKRFAMDETPVTNAQFARFLQASGYRPRHSENFLKHWRGGRPLPGQEDYPVVWVDLEDARAFARWACKRLPTEEEWQYAAQGVDGRSFPWGNTLEPGRCNRGETGTTTPVKAFPRGRSPFGCYDMCGNVWQWTESERSDGRTRFCIIRGGAFYSAKGSGWYVDGGPRPANFATKFLLTWPGSDRCSTIGFRCVADLK
ncbi:MAG: formylglycine-generating enzyme family protein [Limisphaerales bacterium]